MASSGGGRKRKTRRIAGGDKAARPKEGRRSNVVLEWTRSILIILAVFFVLRTFVVQTFVITSGSMENTLLVGDFVVVNRLAIGSTIPFTHIHIPGYSSPERGDVLVFTPPPSDPIGMDLVKRLIGMPGDTIQMKDRVVYIDGKPLPEPYTLQNDMPNVSSPEMNWQKAYLAPWVDPKTYSPSRDDWGPLIIPRNRYFMMGDNRENSLDSRYWGFVTGQELQGRAEFLYFSYRRNSFRPFPWITQIRWGRIGRVIH